MSALSVAEVRQRVATALTGVSGWSESKAVYDLFGDDYGDTDNRQDKSFAVGAIRTEPIGDRQRVNLGTTVRTTIAVRWARRIPSKAQIDGYDGALDSEQALIIAAMTVGQSQGLHVWISEASRNVSTGWMIGEIVFSTMHLFALA